MQVLGIDIGGSGIKGAPVDIKKGELAAPRHRIPTPQPSKPEAVAKVIKKLVEHFDWHGPIGCTFPAIVHHGVIKTAANVDQRWIGVDSIKLFEEATNCPVRVINDGDAAGVAEMAFGAGRHRKGVVIMLTLGTGIGSAIFTEGVLVPNTEFGHLPIRGVDAEDRASDRIRKEEDLSWKRWSERMNEYLAAMEFFFSPDLFIIGGGVSKKHHKYLQYFESDAEIVPAVLRNEAGIIGAAMAASDLGPR